MTDPITTTTVERPTLLTQRTIAAIAGAALALVLLIVCALTWHDWAAGTDAQRIDKLGWICILLVGTVGMIIASFSLPTNGSETFSGPGISFAIRGARDAATPPLPPADNG